MTNNLQYIIKSLNGRMTSSTSGVCCCPAHDDKNPSLSVAFKDGKWLFTCFAGCEYPSIVAALESQGLIDKIYNRDYNKSSYPVAKVAKAPKVNRNLEYAKQIWDVTLPAEGTPVEVYLRKRGYVDKIPPNLRYHPKLKHSKSDSRHPAMIAQVTDRNNKLIAIHRTYLAEDGKSKADIPSNKMMLASISGGAVKFANPCEKLIITEGVETALSVYQTTRISTWAALSCTGMKNIVLPPVDIVPELIIAADADKSGQIAANLLADRETTKGRRVRIAMPPEGLDFNDMLLLEGELCL